MRKLILKMSVSVDGFVGGPNGEVDWVFRSMDDEATKWVVDTLSQVGVHIMGSRTFHDMQAYWPTSTEPFAAPMNEIPKVVFSKNPSVKSADASGTTTALRDARRRGPANSSHDSASTPAILASWADARVASGDLAEEIARLKAEPGKNILAHGGARFVQSLAKLRLIDEYRLVIHPVALGSGLPLFSGLAKPLDLQLVSATPFRGGAVAHVYRTGD
jgi:dihydrofolate reductase